MPLCPHPVVLASGGKAWSSSVGGGSSSSPPPASPRWQWTPARRRPHLHSDTEGHVRDRLPVLHGRWGQPRQGGHGGHAPREM